MRNLIFLLLVTWLSSAWASEATHLSVVGFSKDGSRLAFQQSGITGGEGIAIATMYFIDVVGNKYEEKPVETRGSISDDEKAVLKANLEQTKDKLNELGIIADNPGEQVLARPLSDVGADPKKAKFVVGVPLTGLAHKTYTVTLELKNGDVECANLGKSQMFNLTVTNENDKKSKPLQNDTKVPESRGCPLDYRIADVFVYQEKFVAVFVNVFTPGFEGQNVRYLVVTGTLP